jgi:hypothetical protein
VVAVAVAAAAAAAAAFAGVALLHFYIKIPWQNPLKMVPKSAPNQLKWCSGALLEGSVEQVSLGTVPKPSVGRRFPGFL